MIRIVFFCLLVFLLGSISHAQSSKSRFSRLSGPEKCWVICHPFKAKTALNISLDAIKKTDSLDRDGIIGHDRNGGKLDAFKHSYWMAVMSRQIGEKSALKLGKAHEKGNYKTFKKGKLEDGFLPDKPSSDMDLFNNKMGVDISSKNSNLPEGELISVLIKAIENGDLSILKKTNTVFLTCQGQVIAEKDLKGKWDNDKCMIPSNQ